MIRRIAVVLFCSALYASAGAAQSGPWLQYAEPAEAGFEAAALERVGELADSARSGAVMALYRGHVIGAWGDVAREFQAHSVRKSLVSALYGIAVARGEIDLDATLAELNLNDEPSLTDAERRATVRHLISARSGIYHPAAYAPSEQSEERPARGSAAPGERFFYNNWDFNAAGVVYEQLTGEDLYASFADRLARPLGMEDYDVADGFLFYEPGLSIHPAHTFAISTRDLARVGQLYLQRGRWNDAQLIPESWIEESTRPISDLGEGAGYGYMWWTWAAGSMGDSYPTLNIYDVILARGTGGQAIFIVPGIDLVVVHRGDTDNGREVLGRVVWRMVEELAAARTGTAAARPRLVPMRALPLASQAPRPTMQYRSLDAAAAGDYVGDYAFEPSGAVGRTYLFRDRLFLLVPGLGEAELFTVERDVFTIRTVPGVVVRYARDANGSVSQVTVTYRGRDMVGTRQ